MAEPECALDERLARLFSTDTSVELVLNVADWRWRAARRLKRWQVITNDVRVLRGSHSSSDVRAWIQLLLSAAGNMAWALGPERDAAHFYRREVERLAHEHAIDVDGELTEFEYIDTVVQGLSRLAPTVTYINEVRELVCLSWDEEGFDARPRLMPFLRDISRDPRGALTRLDILRSTAPAALGRLGELVGNRSYGTLDRGVIDEVNAFLAESQWWEYDLFRIKLLMFCVREMISPQGFVQVLEDRPEYVITGNRRLGDVIATDWPLLFVFRACELSWG